MPQTEVSLHGGVPILMACLKTSNVQTYENVVGALWNCGLSPLNTGSLRASGAPEYLVHPVPGRWLLPVQPLQPVPATAGGPSTTFLTQAVAV